MTYDISLALGPETTVWPGDPVVSFRPLCSMGDGAPCNVTVLSMGSHSGTHVDAPLHFLPEGDGVDKLPLDLMIGPCVVVEHYGDNVMEADCLEKLELDGQTRVLFKTDNSRLWKESISGFDRSFTSLGASGAARLVELGVRLIGIDYLSIEPFGSVDNCVHRMLLANGVTILEGINLAEVPAGIYELICLPLKLTGCDGAPARVILRTFE